MSEKEELLTSEEMAALLPVQSTDESGRERDRRQRIVPYNFRRPDRLSKEQVRSLYLLHDLFAHSLSSSLPLFLRAMSEVNLISVEQQSYGDYLRGLSDPTTIFTVAADNLRGLFAVEMNSSIAFPVIDRMLGGEGRELSAPRAATDLELKILEGFLSVVIDSYREAWKTHVEFKSEIVGRETRPQLLQIVAPSEIVATVVYQVQIGDAKGLMSICLPVAMIETVTKTINQSSYSPDNSASPEAVSSLLRTISGARFNVSSELEMIPVAVSDLMALSVGDVLRTNHSVEKAIRISIADILKFKGKLAGLDGKLVVQVTEQSGRQAKSAS
ncbi:MAG: flagellar motor switch protein FliM [Pyrinomonadaceae bacterium]